MSSTIPETPGAYREWWSKNAPEGVAFGYCWCGCGERTTISPHTSRFHGHVKGQPRRFVYQHHGKPARWFSVEDRGFDTFCWVWQGSTTGGKFAYGRKRIDGKLWLAHRLFYERKYGPLGEGDELHHLCGVTLCCNPDHVVPFTRKEHVRRNPNVRLNFSEAQEIRRLYATGRYRQKDIAAMFAIYQADVSRIVLGKYWT